jgi:hypothetical protein
MQKTGGPFPKACALSAIPSRHSAWTIPEIRLRFEEAAHTLRRLPLPRDGRPHDWRVSWPDVVYDWLAYGWLPARAQGIRPTPVEITRMDEVLQWLHWLTRDQRMILWARANHWAWRKLEALDELERNGRGRTERQLRNILGDAEARIVAQLNGTPGRMVLDPEQLRQKASETALERRQMG